MKNLIALFGLIVVILLGACEGDPNVTYSETPVSGDPFEHCVLNEDCDDYGQICDWDRRDLAKAYNIGMSICVDGCQTDTFEDGTKYDSCQSDHGEGGRTDVHCVTISDGTRKCMHNPNYDVSDVDNGGGCPDDTTDPANECEADSDCGSGQICSSAEKCVDDGICVADSQCPSGQICSAGQCVDDPTGGGSNQGSGSLPYQYVKVTALEDVVVWSNFFSTNPTNDPRIITEETAIYLKKGDVVYIPFLSNEGTGVCANKYPHFLFNTFPGYDSVGNEIQVSPSPTVKETDPQGRTILKYDLEEFCYLEFCYLQ